MRSISLFLILTITALPLFSQSPRPQTPKGPFDYRVSEVKIPNKKDGVVLSGTLTMPAKGKGFAAAIMITGSGPQDRDETIMEHKPFAVIADYLTRNGIAVLRCDDRGTGKSNGNFEQATSADFANDILACFDFLKKEKKIDKTKIGVIGHSEGGMVAAMVAAQQPETAFVISLAGTGVPGIRVLDKQNLEINLSMGLPRKDAEANRDNVMQMLDVVLTTQDSKLAEEKLNLMMDSLLAPQKEFIPNFEEYKRSQINGINSRWMKFFLQYDPATDWEKVKCPTLLLNGEKDLQVDATINLEAISKALEKGGNYNYRTVVFQRSNHLFQVCEKCTLQEYATIEETIAPDVLEEMLDYIRTTVLNK